LLYSFLTFILLNILQCAGGKIGIAHSPAWFEPQDLEHVGGSIERVLDFILGW